MARWTIENVQSGLVLGTFEGATEDAALDAMARDAGYADRATMDRDVPDGAENLVVTEVEID